MKLILPFLIFGTIYCRKWSHKEKREKINEVTKTELPLPDFLCEDRTTPSTFIKHGTKPNKKSIIKLGIQIDNYSGFTLKNPLFHPYKGYESITITNATKLEEVLPHRTGFIVLKNSAKFYVEGSISWEIFSGEKHTGRRMAVTFGIPYKGDCASQHRGNHYSLYIQDIKKSIKDNKWINTDMAKNDYNNYHGESSFFKSYRSLWGKGHTKLKHEWRNMQFYTESSITPYSCTPILNIKLLKNLQEYQGNEFEGLSKFCSCTGECATKEEQLKNGLPALDASTMSMETGFLIIVLSVAGGIVFFIILGLALKNLKNSRKFRGP